MLTYGNSIQQIPKYCSERNGTKTNMWIRNLASAFNEMYFSFIYCNRPVRLIGPIDDGSDIEKLPNNQLLFGWLHSPSVLQSVILLLLPNWI